MRKIGCLTVIILVAIAAWLTRDVWWSWVRGVPRSAPADAAAGGTWQPLTAAGAERAKVGLERLGGPAAAPAYVTIAPADLVAYIFQELSRTLPSSADSVEAAAIGDRLYLRALVRTSELGDRGALGPLSLLLGERERLQMGGTLRVIRPGLAEFQVKELRIRELTLPQALIPRLIGQLSRGQRPPELSPDGLALQTPEYIGDVRIAMGQVTLYKAATAP